MNNILSGMDHRSMKDMLKYTTQKRKKQQDRQNTQYTVFNVETLNGENHGRTNLHYIVDIQDDEITTLSQLWCRSLSLTHSLSSLSHYTIEAHTPKALP